MWPHQYIKTGHKKEVGENHFAERFSCVHCNKAWWNNESQPSGPCPARKDQEELKRLTR